MEGLGPKRRSIGLLIVAVLAFFTLTWVLLRAVATGNREQTSAIQSPGTTSGAVVVRGESFLPEGTVMVSELRGDVDQDGMAEIVIAFNDESQSPAGGAGGFLVVDTDNDPDAGGWRTRPPSKGRVTDLVLEDINQDGDLEILLYKAAQDDVSYYLHIYEWDGSDYVQITPLGGPLDGTQAFVSAYYPPDLADVDMDGYKELLAYEEQAAYERLEVLVYVWNVDAFIYDDSYIVLGPRRP